MINQTNNAGESSHVNSWRVGRAKKKEGNAKKEEEEGEGQALTLGKSA